MVSVKTHIHQLQGKNFPKHAVIVPGANARAVMARVPDLFADLSCYSENEESVIDSDPIAQSQDSFYETCSSGHLRESLGTMDLPRKVTKIVQRVNFQNSVTEKTCRGKMKKRRLSPSFKSIADTDLETIINFKKEETIDRTLRSVTYQSLPDELMLLRTKSITLTDIDGRSMYLDFPELIVHSFQGETQKVKFEMAIYVPSGTSVHVTLSVQGQEKNKQLFLSVKDEKETKKLELKSMPGPQQTIGRHENHLFLWGQSGTTHNFNSAAYPDWFLGTYKENEPLLVTNHRGEEFITDFYI
ncbi:interleukin-1 alpha-like [Tachyglossus aculeatus]|uniref:interleukin-1 alpha-like n=1 Tax=Tachyglossus aculeatus TaxID=9261 RepID=UPI0018F7A004|nr:interleukin-1 alpha-like [Tachyglossus aculeatus]